ncbi:hypothetical protein [Leifsonia poae]|uniref:hypothetical protein n=1 Tax=Leifsonia poae TaxID=110933 RepID=UPI003D66CDE7
MSIGAPKRKQTTLYIVMATLIAVVTTSIVIRIVVALVGHNDLGRIIDTITFGALALFFLVFGIYSGKKGKTVQSTGGYVGAGVWALYTVFLAIGAM